MQPMFAIYPQNHMKKILLFGAHGLLGSEIAKVFSKEHTVIKLTHKDADVTDDLQVRKIFEMHLNCDVVINATGYTKVDLAESDKEKAFEINERAVKNLVKLTAEKNIPFVHFSTDYVFDGEKKSPYTEDDPPYPINVYGASKYAGEKHVRAYEKSFLIRTAWLYGAYGDNFVDKMLILSRDKQTISVVNDQIGSPTSARDLAVSLLALLKSQKYGIYHIVNGGQASWYEFAREIFHQLGVPIIVEPTTTQSMNRPARRPTYSVLANTKLAPLQHWKTALSMYLMEKQLII